MSDDVDILRELVRSVYLTSRQRDALRRVLALVSRGPRRAQLVKKTTEAGTPASCSPVPPLLGPGDEP